MLQCLKREPGFYRYLWGLTGPIALQNLITFTLGLMDTLMVSWLGNTQMAAVTTANVPVFLLISIVFGVQSGLSILVSQYWGKRDMEHISRAIGVAARRWCWRRCCTCGRWRSWICCPITMSCRCWVRRI